MKKWTVHEFSGCFEVYGPKNQCVEFAGNGYEEDKRLANEYALIKNTTKLKGKKYARSNRL